MFAYQRKDNINQEKERMKTEGWPPNGSFGKYGSIFLVQQHVGWGIRIFDFLVCSTCSMQRAYLPAIYPLKNRYPSSSSLNTKQNNEKEESLPEISFHEFLVCLLNPRPTQAAPKSSMLHLHNFHTQISQDVPIALAGSYPLSSCESK